MALATTEGKLDINLQLDAKMSRIIKVSARVDPAAGVICAQNMRLQAFRGDRQCPSAALLAGVTEEQLQNAATYMGSRTVQEILKTYGPNEDTMLIVFCGKRICAQNWSPFFQKFNSHFTQNFTFLTSHINHRKMYTLISHFSQNLISKNP